MEDVPEKVKQGALKLAPKLQLKSATKEDVDGKVVYVLKGLRGTDHVTTKVDASGQVLEFQLSPGGGVPPDANRPDIAPGDFAPQIDGVDVDGLLFKLSDYRGKVVLLDFWGFW